VVLDDVSGGALFAFRERGQNGVLARTPEAVAELQVIPALELADTNFSEIRLSLRCWQSPSPSNPRDGQPP
jgi:hypothetical protein